jgi:RND family efflux transporter MFP subunit
MRAIRSWTLCALTALCSIAGCGREPAEEIETTASPAVTTVTVTPGTVADLVTASGMVAAAPGADYIVTAPAAGRIVELPKAEGEHVRPGDLLVRFEIPSLSSDVAAREAEVQQAQAHVENAQASAGRLTTLVEHGVAAQKDLEDARRELIDARAALTQAQSASRNASVLLARTVVRAPFAGVIAKRNHNPGDLVDASAADIILRVIDPSRLQVVAAVAIPDLPRVRVGQSVRVIAAGETDAEPGKVLTRPAAVDPGGVTADVRVAFDGATDLAAGTPVRAEIVAEQRANALAVPIDAVLHEENTAYLMVAGNDKKAHRRNVTTGLATPREIEITKGLEPGDMVITQGHQGLPDGSPITIAK